MTVPRRAAARRGAVIVAVAAALALPASASASVLSTAGARFDVVQQNVVVSWVDGEQRMLLDLTVTGQVEEGASMLLLLASPTRPEVVDVDDAALQAVMEASAPEVVIENRWWPDLESFGGGSDGSDISSFPDLPIGPDGLSAHGAVPARQLLGWYAEHGIEPDDRAVAAIRSYADAGWAFDDFYFVAGPGSVDGRLPTVELRFATDEPVVPLLLLADNARPFELTTYFVGDQRWDRTDTLRGTAEIRYSGPISASAAPALRDWLEPYGGTGVLTVVSQEFSAPARISEDITFAPSTYGPVAAGETVRTVHKIIFGLPAGLVLVAGGMILVAIGGITISQVLQRRVRR